ncbi:Hypothetical predicted protein [Mytilus galloprovincialis]|uniref:Ubiquitin-like protease family profile domain-containing protein n=1 Tax=Mytilus galloprovincialis TaxID=29158 RepID=A0A8B6E2H7_MYTGA|nr:Hypothetical predicted protein [Mytilus galloprovincialis]
MSVHSRDASHSRVESPPCVPVHSRGRVATPPDSPVRDRDFSPPTAASRTFTEPPIYIKGPLSPLSNFFPCTLVFRGMSFPSSENVYQYVKAVEHSHFTLAEQIRHSKTAEDAKHLSKSYHKISSNWRMFRDEENNQEQMIIELNANLRQIHKISINTPLKQKLMTTPSTNGSIKPNKTPKISTEFSTPKSKKKLELSVIEEDAGKTNIIDEKKNSTEINKSLPVKKRKIDDINLDEMETPTKKTKTLSDLPWIGYCSQQHKQNILNNQYLCSDIIISTQNLLKFEFPEINGFQETTLAPVKVNGKWVSETGFQSQESPSVQIHHNGNAHWVLSLQTRDGNIYLLDSLSLNLTTFIRISVNANLR